MNSIVSIAALVPLLFGASTAAADAPDRALTARASDPSVRWAPCPPVFATGCQMTVMHGDPSKPRADVWLKVPAGYHIAAHSHTSPEHMTLVAGNLEVRYQGQEASVLKPGDFAYGPAKLPHVAVCRSGGKSCILFIAFEDAVDVVPFTGDLALH
jgi:quercetin dioxygenase-like cupin family protein